MTAPLEQVLAHLAAAQHDMERHRDQVAQAVAAVDEALLTIDRARDETDATLEGMPELGYRLAARLTRPDIALPDVVEDAPGWAPAAVSIADRVRFTVVLDETMKDPVTLHLAAGRASDERLVSLMLDLVGPGDHVLDLGAHVGVFSLAAVAGGCRVLAVEGSPANAALLRASAARNGFHELRIVNAVVSDSAGTISFQPNGPWGHVAWDAEAEEGAITVPAVTIDHLISSLAWPTPAFVKLDVEGSEIKALEGMRHLLESPDAPPILYESNGHALALAGASPNALLARLEAFGYACYQVEANRLTRLSSDRIQVETVAECVALKRRHPGLSGWEIRPAATMDDTLAQVVSESRHPNADCRVYVARTLASFDADFLAHPLVAAALESLRTDPVVEVRDAAVWSAGREVATSP